MLYFLGIWPKDKFFMDDVKTVFIEGLNTISLHLHDLQFLYDGLVNILYFLTDS